MAEVDFSNAKIQVDTSISRYNPTYKPYVNLSTQYLSNANNELITSNGSMNILKNEQKQLVFLYSGTFTASGTEFYIYTWSNNNPAARWRVYNISFQSGDTYRFKIRADLICQ